MNRYPDWSERLARFLAERRDVPFEWGVNDCCIFAADAILVMTGEDFGLEFVGRYEDAGGAVQLLDSLGGVAGVATSKLGEPIGNWPWARRGDIVLADLEGRPTLMVCDGAYVVGPGEDGLAYLPLDLARQVWRVS